MPFDPNTLSPQDRRQYDKGMAEVTRKRLAAKLPAIAEAAADRALKRFSADPAGFLGKPSAKAPTKAAPAARPAKRYQRLTMHRYSAGTLF